MPSQLRRSIVVTWHLSSFVTSIFSCSGREVPGGVLGPCLPPRLEQSLVRTVWYGMNSRASFMIVFPVPSSCLQIVERRQDPSYCSTQDRSQGATQVLSTASCGEKRGYALVLGIARKRARCTVSCSWVKCTWRRRRR